MADDKDSTRTPIAKSPTKARDQAKMEEVGSTGVRVLTTYEEKQELGISRIDKFW